MKVFWGTMGVLAVSTVLFIGIRAMAQPAPKTMTKEWQEATNEYLRVSQYNIKKIIFEEANISIRNKIPNLLLVYRQKDTRARAIFRVNKQAVL
jgi:hypothetical protein